MENQGEEFKKYFLSKHNTTSAKLEEYGEKMKMHSILPHIPEKNTNNIAVIDVFSKMMMDRVVFLGEDIDEYVANIISAQLLFLDSQEENNEDIHMYINSVGGEVHSGNAIMDIMDYISSSINTVCFGLAGSMAALILSNGEKGKRYGLKRSQVMIHQPIGGQVGQSSDVEITAENLKNIKNQSAEDLAENTGQSKEQILKDFDRDYWMTAKEAKTYGIIDKIIKGN